MGAWIEIFFVDTVPSTVDMSHPTMGAWIEIHLLLIILQIYLVAPHDGCVD